MLARLKFYVTADRLGPDMPLTFFASYFPCIMENICRRKFKYFGQGAQFRPGATALNCSRISIGDNVSIKPGCVLAGGFSGIRIEHNVAMGYGIHMYANNHKYENPEIPIKYQGYEEDNDPIIIRSGCWLGANVVILSGVEVGKNTVVAACSVVTRNVPDNALVAGNPARVIRILAKRDHEKK